jgi:DHA3 family macrolide efflux protein-like MFS transporter
MPAAKPLVNSNFLLLAQGTWVNQVGTQIALVATTVWVRKNADSAGLIGLLATASAIPVLLLSPIGGALADRWFRRNSLILCDGLSGIVSCALMFLIWSAAPPSLKLTAVFMATLLLSSASAFTIPAFNALIPDVVDPGHLEKALSVTQASSLVAIICGQALGGLLIGRYSPAVLFGIDAATYFVSAAATCWVRTPAVVPKAAPVEHPIKRLWTEVKEGLQYVRHRRGMRILILSAIPLNVFTTPIFIFLPFYTTNALKEPLSRYGYLLASFSLGLLLGYGLGAKLPLRSSRITSIVFGCVLGNAAICIALSAIHWYAVAALLLACLGGCTGVITLVSLNILIGRSEPDKRGRISAFLVMIAQGLTPSLMALVGLVADSLHGNVRPLYAGCGAILTLLGVSLSMNAELKEFLGGADEG